MGIESHPRHRSAGSGPPGATETKPTPPAARQGRRVGAWVCLARQQRRAFSTGWWQPVEKVPSDGQTRAKARFPASGGSSMEGTSGAVDLEPLRGGSSEAALGPRSSWSAQVDRARGPRELEALAFTRGHEGSRGAIGGGSVPARFGKMATAAALRQTLPLVRRRSRDMRCPSGSGWGKALIAGCCVSKQTQCPALRASRTRNAPDGRCWTVKAGQPLTREPSAGGVRRAGWSLGSDRRLFRGAARLDEMGTSGDATRIRWSAWRMASNPSGALLPTQRKLGAPRRQAWNGDRSILRLCSWIVLIAEVDERHLGPSQLHGG